MICVKTFHKPRSQSTKHRRGWNGIAKPMLALLLDERHSLAAFPLPRWFQMWEYSVVVMVHSNLIKHSLWNMRNRMKLLLLLLLLLLRRCTKMYRRYRNVDGWSCTVGGLNYILNSERRQNIYYYLHRSENNSSRSLTSVCTRNLLDYFLDLSL